MRITLSWDGADLAVTRAIRIGQSWFENLPCNLCSSDKKGLNGPPGKDFFAKFFSFASKASRPFFSNILRFGTQNRECQIKLLIFFKKLYKNFLLR